MRRHQWDSRVRLERTYLTLAAASFALVSALWVVAPAARDHLYREGHAVELLTAWLFMVAAVTGAVTMRRARLRAWHPYALIPAVSLLCFLEEVGWGFKDLRLARPQVLWLKVDGLHDLITLAYAVYLEHGSVRSRAAIGLAAVAVVVGLALTRRRILYPLSRAVRASAPWRFTAIAVALVAGSIVLDLDWLPWRYFKAMEEVIEWDAALALLFAALSIRPSAPAAGRGGPGRG